jgi:hypothetical protein
LIEIYYQLIDITHFFLQSSFIYAMGAREDKDQDSRPPPLGKAHAVIGCAEVRKP